MNIEDDAAKKTFPYGSKEEAERRFDEKVHKRQFTFCPLLRGRCKKECVCYVKLEVVKGGSKEKPFWDCRGGYCTCYMLVRPD